jgi:DNA-binding NarL/FixJ family response regulator
MPTRVFIVEDHDTLRTMLAELVERIDGLELCGQSDSAEAALDCIEDARPDLALIDISLPGMNGIDLAKVLLKRQPETLCVMLTGHRSSGYLRAARQAGVRAYVEKTDLPQLAAVLREIVDGGSRFPDA